MCGEIGGRFFDVPAGFARSSQLSVGNVADLIISLGTAVGPSTHAGGLKGAGSLTTTEHSSLVSIIKHCLAKLS